MRSTRKFEGLSDERDGSVNQMDIIRNLPENETSLVHIVAEHEGRRSGDIYERFHQETGLGDDRYIEVLDGLGELQILDVGEREGEDHGLTEGLSIVYDSDAVLELLE